MNTPVTESNDDQVHAIEKSEIKELKAWLTQSNCQHLLQKFIDNGITTDLLPELDSYSLKEIGVNKLGDRLRLEIAINALKVDHLKNYIDVSELYKRLNLELVATTPSTANEMYNLSSANLSGSNSETTLPQLGNLSSNNLSNQQLPLSSQLRSQSQLQLQSQQPSTPNKDSKKTITFILQDGSVKRVNITGCFNAQAIKRKIAKKLGFKSHSNQFDTYIHSPYNDFRDKGVHGTDSSVVLLYDVELVTICYSPDRMEKHRIILVPKGETPTKAAIEASELIMKKYEGVSSARHSTQGQQRTAGPDAPSTHDYARPNIRNFFGQRPPSELISSNLAEYFPDTKQKDLEKTVRNSVRHSVRLSRRLNLPAGAFSSSSVALNPRASMMSNSTGFGSHRAMSISSSDHQFGFGHAGPGFVGSRREHIPNRTVGDIMVNNISAIDEAVVSSDSASMFSKPTSQFQNPRFHSPAPVPSAVMGSPPLTSQLSRVTSYNQDAHSVISNGSGSALQRISYCLPESDFEGGGIGDIEGVGNGNGNGVEDHRRHSTIQLLDANMSDDEFDDVNDDAIAEELGATGFEHGVPDNWLKGAKIGSGSFGTVYLGMNPFTGELMAVKQIPLHSNKIKLMDHQSKSSQKVNAVDNNKDKTHNQHHHDSRNVSKGKGLDPPSRVNTPISNHSQQDLSAHHPGPAPPPLPQKDPSTPTPVSQKIADQEREMMLLKDLDHENIVRYFGSSTDENYLNIFLEYVPGGSVQTMLNSYGPFEEPLIRNFIRQVLIGLNYLHGEDIIHRDIKGANILIDIKGTVKIGDFGISKKVSTIDEEDEHLKKNGKRASLQGSVFWMAPEVVKQTTYTKKADIWSVGSLIVEMFTGKHPYPELSQMQALFKIGNHIPPTIPEWCTEEARAFLEKTFELHYARRPHASELLNDPFLNALIMSKQ
ncbi:STE11 [Candida metapsilosis]|uniref:mitogen-activated protein kinase kinase kinase n=1 Tax=Candida metapsilosis TaxID=273372 RepID=A0A8H8D902_9ASCO|nr:STE11 [Candida metapsilosis]